MLMKTHVIGGVAAGMAVAQVSAHEPLLIIGAAAFGALIPDIDHTGSTLGRKVPFAAHLIRGIVGHRTFTHSIAFLGIAAWLMMWLPIHPGIVLGILVGMASHILLDAITKDGVKLFWPLPITFRIPLYIRTGGKVEKGVAFILLLVIVWLLPQTLGLGVEW